MAYKVSAKYRREDGNDWQTPTGDLFPAEQLHIGWNEFDAMCEYCRVNNIRARPSEYEIYKDGTRLVMEVPHKSFGLIFQLRAVKV
mgnify:CR=1 FL=1